MFSGGNLDQLAKQAKEKLSKQISEEPAANEDLYASFRDDNEVVEGVNSDTSEETEESVHLQNEPEEWEDLPTLRSEPEEGELGDNPELYAYDEPLFVGGPTITQVETWKRQWEDYNLMAIEIMGQYFVFRTLNRFEYKQLAAIPNLDPLQREEIICETCTLWPSKYDFRKMAIGKAGIPSTYAQIVMENSGFTKDYSIQIL